MLSCTVQEQFCANFDVLCALYIILRQVLRVVATGVDIGICTPQNQPK